MSDDGASGDVSVENARRRDARRALGRRGESLAATFLGERGYRILARNVSLRVGELDLIALDGSTLCFIEVRVRSSSRFGSAEESIGWRKRLHWIRAASAALAKGSFPPYRDLRFDLVAIDASCEPPKIRLIRDAIALG